ncbi:MAG: hypothetical protein RIS36_955 [Pseudomonadota bacterium]|jgi:hypothetical protein
MEDDCSPERAALLEEIQRRITYLLSTDDYTAEEKEAIARRFFQALEREE